MPRLPFGHKGMRKACAPGELDFLSAGSQPPRAHFDSATKSRESSEEVSGHGSQVSCMRLGQGAPRRAAAPRPAEMPADEIWRESFWQKHRHDFSAAP
jgi:hypothetical protein